ncbi:uncharacterized protein EV154DRAFT_527928, partial [Mucor mucedo]|uniref:uncharacterized protein n=1 Tax=Mucor mucedo TaxID=29922 RepID=UPI0022211663
IHEVVQASRNKRFMFSNRRMANDYAASVVLGHANVNKSYKLSMDSTYGYASLSGTFEKQNPIPKIRRVIAQRALVIPVDEYNTSQKCCHSLQQTRNINYSEISYMQQPRLQCKLTCLNHLKCFDDEDNILWNTADCYQPEEDKKSCAYSMVTDRETLVIFIIGSFQNVYPLKLFQHCQQEGSPCVSRFICNRDVNASCNIKTLLTRYIRSGFALDSRYPQLTRTRQEGH